MDRRRPRDPENRSFPRARVSLVALAAMLCFSACSTRLRSLADLVSNADDAPTIVPTTVTWSLSNGSDSIDLHATPSRDATLHYAIFYGDAGVLTAADVKDAVTNCVGACKLARSVPAVTSGTLIQEPGLSDKFLYSVYAIYEDEYGLGPDSDVKRYVGVLPRRNSMQVYSTALASGIGVGATVRYSVYVPPGYYDHPSDTYPVVMYVHGGGERTNNAANPESEFSAMAQTPFAGMIAAGDDFSAIVVQPQCNEALWECVNTNSTDYLAEVVDQVNATYRTNPKKYGVIGMSWGGAGVLNFSYDYPEKVSAVAAVAGGLFYRAADATSLCAKYATNKVALWGINNVQDPWYSPTAITGGGGAAPGDMVATITSNCTGYPDARYTEYNDNSTFPTNFHGHEIFEFTLGNSPFWDYGNCSGGNGWKSWNGTSCSADSTPPTYRMALHPVMAAALQTASTALTGSSTTFSSIVDWVMHFEKP